MRFSYYFLISIIAAASWSNGADSPEEEARLRALYQKNSDRRSVEEGYLAKPLAASFLGSKGTEWLAGGGFQPDGSLVLAGVTIGPEFELDGVKTVVLGKDSTTPAKQDWPIKLDHKGNPRKHKRTGEIQKDKFKPSNKEATGFVIRLAPGFSKVVSSSRLPWRAGSITGATTGKDGFIYISGFGEKEALATLTSNQAEIVPPTFPEKPGKKKRTPTIRTSYIAKLSKDGSKILWLRHLTGDQSEPRLRTLDNGKILFKGLVFEAFDPEGNAAGRVKIPRPMDAKHWALNPETGEFAYGKEHHWPTGREPWRCPELKIYRPDGTVKDHLYDWPGPLVGITRAVSDSALKTIAFADDTLVFTAWSDGGNSVMYCQPYAMQERAWPTSRKDPNSRGLGLTAAGANAMSFAYVLKMDLKTCKIRSGTMLCTTYKGPEAYRVEALQPLRDGSVAVGGRTGGYPLTSTNKFACERGGANVTVLDPTYSKVRFGSSLPGVGNVIVGFDENMNFIHGTAGGRELLVAVTAAVEDKDVPLVKPLQGGFAGGHLDGYFLVLDVTGK